MLIKDQEKIYQVHVSHCYFHIFSYIWKKFKNICFCTSNKNDQEIPYYSYHEITGKISSWQCSYATQRKNPVF